MITDRLLSFDDRRISIVHQSSHLCMLGSYRVHWTNTIAHFK